MASLQHYDEFEKHYLKAVALLTILGNQSETNDTNASAVNTVVQQINEHVRGMADSMDAFKQAVDPVTGKLIVVNQA